MAKIIINSIDSFKEKISQKMIATKTIIDDLIIYSYNNKYGKGEIKISKDLVEIFKFGEIESYLKIIPNSTSTFLYNTPFFKKKFKINCTKFLYVENRLTFSYILYDNNIEINRLNIEIIEL